MLSTSNVAIQFGAKPLFEQVTVKFSDGNRYGLIGANGCGKSTLMKILGGELEPSAGDVMLQAGMRLGKLNQNQFAYEDERVLDVVMQGHTEMWQAMQRARPHLCGPERHRRRLHEGGRARGQCSPSTAATTPRRAPAASSPTPASPSRCHNGPMREVPPGLKLRVLLAQALFSKPDVLLLDEPTNNLDIHSIRWLEGALNDYDATMIIISHDRHFLNQVCTHIADLDFQQLKVYPGQLRRFHAGLGAGARSGSKPRTPRPRTGSRTCRNSCGASRPTPPRRARRPRASRQLEKIKIEEIRPSSRQNPYIRFEQAQEAVPLGGLGREA